MSDTDKLLVGSRLRQEQARAAKTEDIARVVMEAASKERETLDQMVLEESALVVNFGDPEPDKPAGGRYFRAQGSSIWYRTLLDGWRWAGECRFGREWDTIPEGFFPLRELVGVELRGLR